MLDKLFIKYVGSPLVILSISHGDWGDNGCLERGGYLGIERSGDEGSERGYGMSSVKHGGSSVFSP
jgi:hypothetical protein